MRDHDYVRCPQCGSDSVELHYSDSSEFTKVFCESCNYAWQEHLVDDEYYGVEVW